MAAISKSTQAAPALVFPWKDEETDACGWVVFDKVINSVCGGGIFMHANATEQETADIARNMTRKFTVCAPQIGGAKAGIRFDHRDPRAESVLRRFIQANKQILRTSWVTAGDLNTDDAFIERVCQEDIGLATCQGRSDVVLRKRPAAWIAPLLSLVLFQCLPANTFRLSRPRLATVSLQQWRRHLRSMESVVFHVLSFRALAQWAPALPTIL